MKSFFKHWRQDLPASLVVFLVALPLCLGIGLASTNVQGINGMPNIFSGLIAGIVGGIVVGSLSGSRLGVSGPAAGLITIVTAAILTLGSFEAFLTAVVLAGIIQLIAGFLKAGVLSKYFPSSVVKGMLAAIGLTLILKEIPHFFGYDEDFIGDEALNQMNGHNTFSDLGYMLESIHPAALTISVISLLILILFEQKFMKKFGLFKILPGALFVVIIGILLNEYFISIGGDWVIKDKHLVQIPVISSLEEFTQYLTTPDFSSLKNWNVYAIALTLAIVGSLETLLSVEATDKLDPEKHHTPTNRELKAQGVGNIVSGMLGGLPITQVIVRSSANINTGAKSKLSAILHGILLVSAILFISDLLNKIPMASLAAILLMIGYKLSNIKLYRSIFRQGLEQFLPFIATIIGVLLTNLLAGIGIGVVFAIFFILRRNYKNDYIAEEHIEEGHRCLKIKLPEELTFLNKASIFDLLDSIEEESNVELDGSKCTFIDHDALEILKEFQNYTVKEKRIHLNVINVEPLNNIE